MRRGQRVARAHGLEPRTHPERCGQPVLGFGSAQRSCSTARGMSSLAKATSFRLGAASPRLGPRTVTARLAKNPSSCRAGRRREASTRPRRSGHLRARTEQHRCTSGRRIATPTRRYTPRGGSPSRTRDSACRRGLPEDRQHRHGYDRLEGDPSGPVRRGERDERLRRAGSAQRIPPEQPGAALLVTSE
jgi:hypothetical protein